MQEENPMYYKKKHIIGDTQCKFFINSLYNMNIQRSVIQIINVLNKKKKFTKSEYIRQITNNL